MVFLPGQFQAPRPSSSSRGPKRTRDDEAEEAEEAEEEERGINLDEEGNDAADEWKFIPAESSCSDASGEDSGSEFDVSDQEDLMRRIRRGGGDGGDASGEDSTGSDDDEEEEGDDADAFFRQQNRSKRRRGEIEAAASASAEERPLILPHVSRNQIRKIGGRIMAVSGGGGSENGTSTGGAMFQTLITNYTKMGADELCSSLGRTRVREQFAATHGIKDAGRIMKRKMSRTEKFEARIWGKAYKVFIEKHASDSSIVCTHTIRELRRQMRMFSQRAMQKNERTNKKEPHYGHCKQFRETASLLLRFMQMNEGNARKEATEFAEGVATTTSGGR